MSEGVGQYEFAGSGWVSLQERRGISDCERGPPATQAEKFAGWEGPNLQPEGGTDLFCSVTAFGDKPTAPVARRRLRILDQRRGHSMKGAAASSVAD